VAGAFAGRPGVTGRIPGLVPDPRGSWRGSGESAV